MWWRLRLWENKIKRLIGYNSSMWKGDYATWEDAKQHCKGYDAAPILEKCKAAMLKVKAGEAAYERDSILHHEPQYSWELLTVILKIAHQTNFKVHILDFGGSLGSVYFQNKKFLQQFDFQDFSWNIVEQPNFVKCGKKYAEDGILKFYNTIEDCLKEKQPHIILASGVVSHVENPYFWIDTFKQTNASYIILDRIPIIEGTRDIITVQNVFTAIYEGSYPCRFFNENNLTNSFTPYTIEAITVPYDDVVWLNGRQNVWKGYILNNNNIT